MTQGQIGLNVAKAVIGAYKQISEEKGKKKMLDEYLTYGQAKIVVKAMDQEEVLKCQEKAKVKNINNFIIEAVDKNGETIYPCLAIGPDRTSRINQITGHLKLL